MDLIANSSAPEVRETDSCNGAVHSALQEDVYNHRLLFGSKKSCDQYFAFELGKISVQISSQKEREFTLKPECFLLLFALLLKVLVGLGTASFMNGNITSRVADQGNSWIGLVLMFGNIFFDSLLMAYQERLFLGYRLSSNSQMLYVNLFSGLLSLLSCIPGGALRSSLSLLSSSRQFARELCLLTLGAVSAQFFITSPIKEFGAVFFGTVITVSYPPPANR